MKNVVVGILVVAVAVIGVSCDSLKGVKKVGTVITKDLALEDQLALLDKYRGRHAWTRGVLEHLTERVDTPGEPKKKIILRDTKVTIVDLNFVYRGAVTVDDPKGKRIVAGLNIQPPLSPEKYDARLAEIFWFEDPTLRHVEYIRKWGKKTARAVMNHEVFAGMPAEAAIESWGLPDETRVSEIGQQKEEQWVYKQTKRSKYIYVIDNRVGRWEE